MIHVDTCNSNEEWLRSHGPSQCAWWRLQSTADAAQATGLYLQVCSVWQCGADLVVLQLDLSLTIGHAVQGSLGRIYKTYRISSQTSISVVSPTRFKN